MQKLSLIVRSTDRPLAKLYSSNNGEIRESTTNEVELKTDNMTIHVSKVKQLTELEFTGEIEYFTENNSKDENAQIFSYLGHKNGDPIEFLESNIFG